MDSKIETVFQSELRVIKNGKVIEKERGAENDGEYNHNNKS